MYCLCIVFKLSMSERNDHIPFYSCFTQRPNIFRNRCSENVFETRSDRLERNYFVGVCSGVIAAEPRLIGLIQTHSVKGFFAAEFV